jgi:homogentisate 1,2-dioxygenase
VTIERLARGELPAKHHITMRDEHGALRWEECITAAGFDGPYTIAYHERRPHEARVASTAHGWPAAKPANGEEVRPLARRHYRSQELTGGGGAPIDARLPMMFNADMVLGVSRPDRADPVYCNNGDADDLVFVHRGGGLLRTLLGDVPFDQGDYVFVPRGLIHRWIPTEGLEQVWLTMECLSGVGLLKQWRNNIGQLKMDAPYCHRDFRLPTFVGPVDEGMRELVVKRGGRFHGFTYAASPLDVIGWDGTLYPWAFPILNFQPRAGQTHLPPTWHGTFATKGALICSFVPRTVDFHPEAIPCPYPHSSVDMDEFLFYVAGNFTSRKGVGPGSISHHPAGIPHGPHPGAYEASVGTLRTDELAVMVDTWDPLVPTAAALQVEHAGYHDTFIE